MLVSVRCSVATPVLGTVAMGLCLLSPARRAGPSRRASTGRRYTLTAGLTSAAYARRSLRRRRVRRVLGRVEAPAVDELDAVAVGVGDEDDARQVVASAGLVGRLLRLHAQ